jgi:NTP pyrophosphatase (non-canonical NTP hydrolase)
VTLREFQRLIEAIYYARDGGRGVSATFQWLAEEVGELARALRKGEPENLREEFADACAWLFSLASLAGVDMQEAVDKYAGGCPRCREAPCACPPESRAF